jgi:hypothetical protein
MREPRAPAGGVAPLACLTIGAATVAALTTEAAPLLVAALAAAGCAALSARFDAASPGTRRLALARRSSAFPRRSE